MRHNSDSAEPTYAARPDSHLGISSLKAMPVMMPAVKPRILQARSKEAINFAGQYTRSLLPTRCAGTQSAVQLLGMLGGTTLQILSGAG
jgi:hypothetical protein